MDRFRAFCFGVGGRVCRKLPPRRTETASSRELVSGRAAGQCALGQRFHFCVKNEIFLTVFSAGFAAHGG